MEQEQHRKNIGGIRKKDFIKKTKMNAANSLMTVR